jgi:Ca2+-binding RTX toxin-like protein
MGKFEWSVVRRAVLVAVVLSGGLPVCAQAAPIDLLTQADVRLDGAGGGDQSGWSVSEAGDFNADGRDDVIIGARQARTNAGSSYVVFGSATPSTVDLASLTPAQGIRIDGATPGDESGYSVSGAGDFNADGTDDVIVGAHLADNHGNKSGSSYVVFGSASPGNVDLASLTTAQGIRIDGAASFDESGYSVAGAGDFNADGRDDVIIGAPDADNHGNLSGSSYVVFGSASPGNVDLASLTTSQGIRIDGATALDDSGESVSGAGDFNADGRDDVIVGAPAADNLGRPNSGSSYVVFGSASLGNVDLASLTTAQGIRIDGTTGVASGWSVSGAGDVNADGTDDVIIGAPDAHDNNRAGSGSSYVVFGAATPGNVDLASLGTSQGIRIEGATALDHSGWSVSGAGDVNADGTDDVIIGAHLADHGRPNSGSSYVLFGSASPGNVDLASLTTAQGIRIDGATQGDESGYSVSGAGDFNGDGTDDVIVGAPHAHNNNRGDSGSSYVVFGSIANTAPVAAPDAYAAVGGAPLTVPAPGVLGNDSDADHDPLTAQLVSPTTRGTLVLNADGSLTYTPGEDSVGIDTFTYRASDGTDVSNPVTVTITITAGCEGKRATIIGTDSANVINGTGGDDVIVGLGGNDAIDGGSGNDTICAGSGSDTITGGSGNDTLRGGSGNDSLTGGSGNDTLHGDDGDDSVDGGGDNDRVFGDAGIDRLLGGGGDDALDGGAGTPDRCDGEGGSDTATACENTTSVP